MAVAEYLFGSLVEIGDDTAFIYGDDGAGNGIQDGVQFGRLMTKRIYFLL